MVAFVFAAVFLCYWPALRGSELWDDGGHITRPDLRSISGLLRIWFDLHATQQYYPLLHTAFWVEYHLWGIETVGYHMVNILEHATSACLLMIVLRQLRVRGAIFAGMLFALHPVCVESVAWISEQKNTQSLVLYLLAMLAYLRFDAARGQRSAIWSYGLASALFAMAMLTKTVTATLPAALLVIFWWRQGSLGWRRDIRPLVPWLVFAIAYGLLTAWIERTIIGAEGSAFNFTLVQRCLLAGRAVWFYLGKLLWPSNLIFIYPRWDIDSDGNGWFACLLALVGVTALLWYFSRRIRGPLAAWLFYVGSLFPVLGFFNIYPFTFSYVADHFQYLASMGIFAALAGEGALLAGTWDRYATQSATGAPVTQKEKPVPLIFRLAAMALLAVLGILSWRQCRIYRDPEILYRSVLEGNPGSTLASGNLGDVLLHERRFDEAAIILSETVRLNPNLPQVHADLGSTLLELGRFKEAAAEYRAAIRVSPQLPGGHYLLGRALMQAGEPSEAISEFREELVNWGADKARIPDEMVHEAHMDIAMSLMQEGRNEEALAEFRTIASVEPKNSVVRNSMGLVLANLGRDNEAIGEYETAVEANPDFLEAQLNLGLALLRSGDLRRAIDRYRIALKLYPRVKEAHLNLGNALLRSGDLKEAVSEYRTALDLDPHYAAARRNLDATLHVLGSDAEGGSDIQPSGGLPREPHK